jgi:hypothetical protein
MSFLSGICQDRFQVNAFTMPTELENELFHRGLRFYFGRGLGICQSADQ